MSQMPCAVMSSLGHYLAAADRQEARDAAWEAAMDEKLAELMAVPAATLATEYEEINEALVAVARKLVSREESWS